MDAYETKDIEVNGTTYREGNPIHPVFITDEIPYTHCGTCGGEL